MAKKNGRKLKLTPEVQHAIVHNLSKGIWMATAAMCEGVSDATFWRWMASGETRKDSLTGQTIQPEPVYREFREATPSVPRVAGVRRACSGGAHAADPQQARP